MGIRILWPSIFVAVMFLIISGSAGARSDRLAADSTAPTVSITSPAANATVRATRLLISGVASAGAGVSQVEVKVDDGGYQLAYGTTRWVRPRGHTVYGSGEHTVTVRVTDAAGSTASPRRMVTIGDQNVPAAASVSITSPTRDGMVGGLLTVSGVAGGDVARVEVRVDGGAYE